MTDNRRYVGAVITRAIELRRSQSSVCLSAALRRALCSLLCLCVYTREMMWPSLRWFVRAHLLNSTRHSSGADRSRRQSHLDLSDVVRWLA